MKSKLATITGATYGKTLRKIVFSWLLGWAQTSKIMIGFPS